MTDIAKALERIATSGPWEDEPGYNNGGCPTRFFKIPGHQGGETVEMLAPDSLFIAESRTLLPQLVSEVERLSGELVTLKKDTFRAWGAERLAEIARDAAIARAQKAESSRTPPEWRPLSVLTDDVINKHASGKWAVRSEYDIRITPFPRHTGFATECRPVDREGVPVPWTEVGP